MLGIISKGTTNTSMPMAKSHIICSNIPGWSLQKQTHCRSFRYLHPAGSQLRFRPSWSDSLMEDPTGYFYPAFTFCTTVVGTHAEETKGFQPQMAVSSD